MIINKEEIRKNLINYRAESRSTRKIYLSYNNENDIKQIMKYTGLRKNAVITVLLYIQYNAYKKNKDKYILDWKKNSKNNGRVPSEDDKDLKTKSYRLPYELNDGLYDMEIKLKVKNKRRFMSKLLRKSIDSFLALINERKKLDKENEDNIKRNKITLDLPNELRNKVHKYSEMTGIMERDVIALLILKYLN